MDVIVKQINDYTEGRIDFAGQLDVEKLSLRMLIPSALLAFVIGYIAQDIRLALVVYGFCVFLTFGTIIPAWPMYNRHPVAWKKVEVAPFVAETEEDR